MYIVLNCVVFGKTKSISLQQKNVYVVAHFVLVTKKILV